jgi:hypothetical protein
MAPNGQEKSPNDFSEGLDSSAAFWLLDLGLNQGQRDSRGERSSNGLAHLSSG